jgi:hypothetical protein
VYGPRLTGSPNLKAAGEWAIEQMHAWGLKGGRLEPWDFARSGWTNERLAAHIVSPVKDALVAEALAWTPGTQGIVRAQAVQLTLPQRPTRDVLTTHLAALKDVVKGKFVLVGVPQTVLVTFNPPALRREDADVVTQLNAAPAGPPQQNQQPQAPQAPQPETPAEPQPLTNNQIQEQLNQFLLANGAVVRINDAGRDHGQIRAFNNAAYDVAKAPPTVVMRNEDYGRIWRLLTDKRSVELEFDIVNRIYPEGRTSYNATAEIPGTTGEVVIQSDGTPWRPLIHVEDISRVFLAVLEARRPLQFTHVARGSAAHPQVLFRSRFSRDNRPCRTGAGRYRSGQRQHRDRHR